MSGSNHDINDIDGGPDRCWCGVANPYFAGVGSGLEALCGGSCVLHCECGGDTCVCHNHEEIECPGCRDCAFDDELDDDDVWYDDSDADEVWDDDL